MSYVFWTHSLKYTYSDDLMNPINEAFSGVIQKIKNRLKLGRSRQQDPQLENKVAMQDGYNPSPNNVIQANQAPNNQIQINLGNNKDNVSLEFKQETGNKVNKGYDSFQIDFEVKNQQPKVNM